MLVIAASPQDLALGRAALVEDDRAGVADVVVQDKQVALVEIDADGAATVVSLFTSARREDRIPAAFSRQTLIGSIPVVLQSAGTCTAASQGQNARQ